jgi:nitrate reductase / nitrite oxidoreductase, alpha subunit
MTWRIEGVSPFGVAELLSPLADPAPYRGSLIDLNVKAERMRWLLSTLQLGFNPLTVAADAERTGASVKDHVVAGLKSGEITMACDDPDNPTNFPRNLFHRRGRLLRIWQAGRANREAVRYRLH